MSDDYSKLKDLLTSATREHFGRYVQLHPGEAYYGYSLYTDDGVSSIGPVATTGSLLRVNPQVAPDAYFRYGPHEWHHFDDFGLFDAANALLRSLYASRDFESYRRRSLEAAFVALEDLEAQGVFGARNDSRFIVLWVVDSADSIMAASARKLNSRAVYEAFASEYGDGN
jgi:hypothetical protein